MIQSWRDIPGFFDFQDIYDQAVEEAKDGDVLVEVGTFLGKSAAYMIEKIRESKKQLRFCVVDSWDERTYARWWGGGMKDDPPSPWPCPELHGKPLYGAFEYCMYAAGVFDTSVLSVYKRFSVDVARGMTAGFVFIDADHTYEAIRDDIAAWTPVVKPGGIIAGHDYKIHLWPGVEKAVNEAFPGRVEHRNNSWLVRVV